MPLNQVRLYQCGTTSRTFYEICVLALDQFLLGRKWCRAVIKVLDTRFIDLLIHNNLMLSERNDPRTVKIIAITSRFFQRYPAMTGAPMGTANIEIKKKTIIHVNETMKMTCA